MSTRDDDESFERELFAARAAALPSPELDVDDVFRRAEPSEPPLRVRNPLGSPSGRIAIAASVLACAAAVLLVLVSRRSAECLHETRASSTFGSSVATGARGDELACTPEFAASSAELSPSAPREPLATLDVRPIAHRANDEHAICAESMRTDHLACEIDVTNASVWP